MELEDILASAKQADDGTWSMTVTDDWLQGRSVFGGLQGTLALVAMRALVPAATPLRSMQVTFVAPVPQGTVRVRAAVLRAGKNVTQVEARIVGEGDATLCLVVGIFGAGRPSKVVRRPVQPVVERQADAPTMHHVPGLTPAFMQHMHMTWLQGSLPFTGAASPASVIELGLARPGPASELHLPVIADIIPPLAFAMLTEPTMGSSMIWMLELLDTGWERHGVQRWRVDADVPAASDGYTSQSLVVWAPDGSPAMLSRQSMVVFG